ncbi:MAG: hypothetical protein NBV65_12055 [Burkholderiaceae bacterium]|nr:hypothetical protein [Burkholderiaceae bacterium]
MASLHADQAAGLRRLREGTVPGLCTVLSADGGDGKPALMRRLAASMQRRGRAVILVDTDADGPGAGSGLAPCATLADVASGRASLAEAGWSEPDGLRRVRLGQASGEPSLGRLLQQIAGEQARVLVDAELDADGELPLPLLADGEVVVQLSGSPASIRAAYDMLRALKSLCGRGSVSLLVTDADPVHAERVRTNLFHAASRYLALPVRSIVPQESSHV